MIKTLLFESISGDLTPNLKLLQMNSLTFLQYINWNATIPGTKNCCDFGIKTDSVCLIELDDFEHHLRLGKICKIEYN